MVIRAFCGAVMLCGAAAVGTVPAAAADQSAAAPHAFYYPNTYYPAAVLWTGFYLGPSAGGVWSTARWTDPYSGQGDAATGSSIFGGGQVGANWQMDQLVLGAEADFEWMSLGGTATDAAGFQHLISSHWMSTFTGRVGWALNAMLFYFKGGVAFISERDTVNSPFFATASTGTETRGGWTVGGGLEYAFDPHWSARLEYDHIIIDTPGELFSGTVPGTNGLALGPANGNVDWVINRVVGAVNYRF
jgi:outer membrane immunogenic protein